MSWAKEPSATAHISAAAGSADNSVPGRVRSAAARVIMEARHVRIESRELPSLVDQLRQWRSRSWLGVAPVRFDDLPVTDRLAVVLLFNAVSFCYWPAPWWDNAWYKGDIRRGSWALLAALRRAIDCGVPILRPGFLRALTEDELATVLDGRGRLALLGRRAEILREVGTVLDGDLGGRIMNLLQETHFDALALVTAVLNHFPSFKDEASFNGEQVPFAKRAQLFVADCHWIMERSGRSGLRGFDRLTGCADYMLPALLVREGVLEYSPELRALVDKQVPLPCGGAHEVEIRAATVVACDLLACLWQERPMVVNDALWLKAGEAFSAVATHHRTWTEAY